MSNALLKLKEQMEIDFLKEKTYTEINDMFNQMKSKLDNSFTAEEVQQMLMKAFIKGEKWGMTYLGNFDPSKQESAERAASACDQIYNETVFNRKNK